MRFRGKNSISPLKKQHFLQKKLFSPMKTLFSPVASASQTMNCAECVSKRVD